MTEPWTFARNNLFEQALAMYDQDRPDYWQNVARAVGGGITAEEAIRHFARLQRDLNHIDGGWQWQLQGGIHGAEARPPLIAGLVQDGAQLAALKHS